MNTRMKWYEYVVRPIDLRWDLLFTVEEFQRRLVNSIFGVADLKDFETDWEIALKAAKSIGWEGDFAGEPVVMTLPSAQGFSWGFVFKQNNNGSTFIISPVPLPYLKKL